MQHNAGITAHSIAFHNAGMRQLMTKRRLPHVGEIQASIMPAQRSVLDSRVRHIR